MWLLAVTSSERRAGVGSTPSVAGGVLSVQPSQRRQPFERLATVQLATPCCEGGDEGVEVEGCSRGVVVVAATAAAAAAAVVVVVAAGGVVVEPRRLPPVHWSSTPQAPQQPSWRCCRHGLCRRRQNCRGLWQVELCSSSSFAGWSVGQRMVSSTSPTFCAPHLNVSLSASD